MPQASEIAVNGALHTQGNEELDVSRGSMVKDLVKVSIAAALVTVIHRLKNRRADNYAIISTEETNVESLDSSKKQFFIRGIARTFALDWAPDVAVQRVLAAAAEYEKISDSDFFLFYGSKTLHPDMVLADYNIQPGSTVFLCLPLDGGGVSKKRHIPFTDFRPRETDLPNIRSILSLESFDVLRWLSGLTREQLTQYQRDLESKRGLDHYIATTLNYITELVSIKDEVQVVNDRLAAAEMFLKSLVTADLERYEKGEWVGIVRSRISS